MEKVLDFYILGRVLAAGDAKIVKKKIPGCGTGFR
jgi:hypothetical protein